MLFGDKVGQRNETPHTLLR